MLFYPALFILVAVAGTLLDFSWARERSLQVYCAYAILFSVIVGFRHGSVDYGTYASIYAETVATPFFESISSAEDPGFALLIQISYALGGNFYWFVLALALVSVFIKFWAFHRVAPLFGLAVTLYLSGYFFKEIGQMRNAFASGVFLLALVYLAESKRTRFATGTALAGSVHAVAWGGFIAYVTRWLRPSRKLLFLTLGLGVLVSAFGGAGQLLTWAAGAILGMDESARIVRYVDKSYAEPFRLFGGTMMILTGIAAVLTAYLPSLERVNPAFRTLVASYVFGAALFCVFRDYGILAARIKDLFCLPLECVLLPALVAALTPSSRPIGYFAVLLYATLLFSIRVQGRVPYELLPIHVLN